MSEGGRGLELPVGDVHGLYQGAVVFGDMVGAGTVRSGDLAVCDLGRFEIRAIAAYHGEVATEDEARTGAQSVEMTLGGVAEPSDLRGRTLRFAARPSGMPSLVDGRIPVPDQSLLVNVSRRRASPMRRFAVLELDGRQVRLLHRNRGVLIDCPGDELSADAISETQVALRGPDDAVHYLVGPEPRWQGTKFTEQSGTRHPIRVLPDPRLVPIEISDLGVTPPVAAGLIQRMWTPALVQMLRTRGVRPLPG